MDTLHTPERLFNEDMSQYADRLQASRRAATRTRLVYAGNRPASAPRAKTLRRQLVKQVGIRQAKKALRVARATVKEASI